MQAAGAVIRVELLSREPFLGEDHEHEWVSGRLWCDIALEDCTAQVRRPLSMPLEYLREYAEALDDLATSLDGKAQLSSLEPGIEMTVTLRSGAGSAVGAVAIGDYSGKLSFTAPTDQSYLLPARRGLAELLREFPSRRG